MDLSKIDWATMLPVLVNLVVLVVLPLGYKAAKKWADKKGLVEDLKADKLKRDIVLTVADVVYSVVEGVSRLTPMEADDKLAEGLHQIREQLGRDLSDAEHKLAKAAFAASAWEDKKASLNLAEIGYVAQMPVE